MINYRIELDLDKKEIRYIANIYANSDLIKFYVGSTELEVIRLANGFIDGIKFARGE
jgi:hypothetical protein